MEKVKVVYEIPQEISLSADPILLVTEKAHEIPQFIRKWPRVDCWFAEQIDWRYTKRIPNRTKFVVISQTISNNVVAKLSQMTDPGMPIWRFNGTKDKMFSALANMMPENFVPETYRRKQNEKEFPAVENTLNHHEERATAATEEIATPDEKKRKKCAKGSITKFVRENANFSTKQGTREARRVFELAIKQGLQTTQSSIYQAYNKLRNDLKKNQSQEAAGAPVNQGPKVQELEKAPQKTGEKIQPERVPDAVIQKREEELVHFPQEEQKWPEDEWFDPNKSVWVSYIHNPYWKKDASGTSDQLRKWIGFVTGKKGKDKRDVIPGAPHIDRFINEKYAETKTVPVDIPCFLDLRYRRYFAVHIDFERLSSQKDISVEAVNSLRQEIHLLESRLFRAESELAESRKHLEKIKIPQKMAVVFDYDNYMKSCHSLNIGILPGQLVDKLAGYRTQAVREVTDIVVVGFEDKAYHRFWRGEDGFRLYAVPQPNGGKNLTDEYVQKAALESAEKLPPGSLIALVSSDSDYKPLILDLKNRQFQTLVVGNFPDDMNDEMFRSSNLRINLRFINKAFTDE